MCGIAGLFLKNKALEPQLGAMLHRMLETLSDRGPNSAGFAVFGGGEGGRPGRARTAHGDRGARRLGGPRPNPGWGCQPFTGKASAA